MEEFYYLDIFLKKTYKNLGQFETINPNSQILGTLEDITFTQTTLSSDTTQSSFFVNVSGLTTSRLAEVKRYNKTTPYKIGVNGVTGITSQYIEYIIDDVYYRTFLSDGLTFFQLLKITNELEKQNIIADDNSVSIDIKKTLNAMVIDRSNIAVYEYFNKINNCSSLDDILDIF
jgi:hypothetical protein